MAKKKVNSKQKGNHGEREAAAYLRSLGFNDAKRTQQYKGTSDSSDVECPETLPNVFFEVKFGYPRSVIDVGTKGLRDAVQKAHDDCAGKWPCVMWKPKGCQQWRVTYREDALGLESTVAGNEDIYALLIASRP